MSDKSRDMLKIIVGLYLVWLGFDLGKSALTNRPDNYLVFILCGAAFIIVGGAIAISSAKRRMKPDAYDEVEDEDEADEAEAKDGEESLITEETVIEGVVEDGIESTEEGEDVTEKTVE